MIWQDFLTPAERARIEAIPAERLALTKEYRTLYERCRKRMERGTKAVEENAGELSPETRTKPPVTD